MSTCCMSCSAPSWRSTTQALALIASITTLTLVTLALIYRPLVLECLDPGFLRSVSARRRPDPSRSFSASVVLNLVGGFQALGTLLAVGIMMLPAAAARFWSADITMMLFLPPIMIGVASSVSGLLVSYHFEAPTGPAIILVAGAFYLLSILVGPRGRPDPEALAKAPFRIVMV